MFNCNETAGRSPNSCWYARRPRRPSTVPSDRQDSIFSRPAAPLPRFCVRSRASPNRQRDLSRGARQHLSQFHGKTEGAFNCREAFGGDFASEPDISPPHASAIASGHRVVVAADRGVRWATDGRTLGGSRHHCFPAGEYHNRGSHGDHHLTRTTCHGATHSCAGCGAGRRYGREAHGHP